MKSLPSIPLPAEMNFLEVTPAKPCPTLIILSFWIQLELEPIVQRELELIAQRELEPIVQRELEPILQRELEPIGVGIRQN